MLHGIPHLKKSRNHDRSSNSNSQRTHQNKIGSNTHRGIVAPSGGLVVGITGMTHILGIQQRGSVIEANEDGSQCGPLGSSRTFESMHKSFGPTTTTTITTTINGSKDKGSFGNPAGTNQSCHATAQIQFLNKPNFN